jgi:molecular chaperone GrpE
MTTNNAKFGGATPKKSVQTAAKKRAAGLEKAPERAPEAPEEENKKTDAPETPSPDETAQASEASESDAAATDDCAGAQTAQDEEMNAKYMRLAADFQNYKRRVEKEKSDVYAYANEKIAVDLLGVIDNFERALEPQSGADAKEESFAKGMELIFRQLLDILSKNGVEEIPSLGEDFDPALHNAVMTEAAGEYESGKVSAVLGKGYKLRDRVIRPAMVKVTQ